MEVQTLNVIINCPVHAYM